MSCWENIKIFLRLRGIKNDRFDILFLRLSMAEEIVFSCEATNVEGIIAAVYTIYPTKDGVVNSTENTVLTMVAERMVRALKARNDRLTKQLAA
jgi:hypothetical protein